MHPIYHTDAIVLGSAERGEADKVFFLFTREQGLLRVTATGIRKLASKLRYGLQDYDVASVGLVRGKNSWRLTSATPKRIFDARKKNLLKAFQNTSRLLARMTPRETQESELFDEILRIYQSADILELTPHTVSDIALFSAVKTLSALGYLSDDVLPEEILKTTDSPLPLAEVRLRRKSLMDAVKMSIESSHLIR